MGDEGLLGDYDLLWESGGENSNVPPGVKSRAIQKAYQHQGIIEDMMYRLLQTCWDKCVKIKQPNIVPGESVCIRRCQKKYATSYNIVRNNYLAREGDNQTYTELFQQFENTN
eukprot:TRINITY_DN8509_c0_g1_i1.p1 TRINITY_DN8509_c0_g1~~TRINITY_DN8509_c0_g1_i1.p1  ORF type:complete len:122 (-),score=15.45 TRINITY_DN8509_c0_g1_i1:192-530(-)